MVSIVNKVYQRALDSETRTTTSTGFPQHSRVNQRHFGGKTW